MAVEMAGGGGGDGGRWWEMAGDGGRSREIAMEVVGDGGVRSGGGCRWAWRRAAAAVGVAACVGRGGRGGGCLVGQVAPVEVGPSIVVRMHLRPRGRVAQRWEVALRASCLAVGSGAQGESVRGGEWR